MIGDGGVQTDFGFSFNAAPTIDTVLYFRRQTKEGGVWMEEDGDDLKTQVQVEQAKLIFELQIQDIYEQILY